jgi:hypothetical protein
MRLLLMLGLLLTPFSSGVGSGIPVVSFGLPFLAAAALLSVVIPSANGFALPRAVMPALLASAGVVIVMTVCTFFAPHLGRSIGRLAPNLIGFVLCVRLVALRLHERGLVLEQALKLLAFSGALMSLFYIFHLLIAISQFGIDVVLIERYTGGAAALPWGASNVISAALLYPHIACHVLGWRSNYRWSPPILLLILITVALTMSRTGLLLHFTLLIVGSLLSGNYRYPFYAFLVVAAIVRLYLSVAPDTFDFLLDARFNADMAGGADISNGRLDSFAVKSEYLLHNLMAPIGYYGSLFVFGLTAHNYLLTLLVEQGIPGLIAFVAFVLCACFALFRKAKLSHSDIVSRRLLFAGALLAFANLMVEDAHFSQPYIAYFWTYFFIVMMFSAGLRSQETARRVPSEGSAVHV